MEGMMIPEMIEAMGDGKARVAKADNAVTAAGSSVGKGLAVGGTQVGEGIMSVASMVSILQGGMVGHVGDGVGKGSSVGQGGIVGHEGNGVGKGSRVVQGPRDVAGSGIPGIDHRGGGSQVAIQDGNVSTMVGVASGG